MTSDYHAPRALLLFEQVFLTVAPDLLGRVGLEGLPAATAVRGDAAAAAERARLFENERNWLRPGPLAVLLTNMTGHPFLLPTAARIQQARDELDSLE